MSFASGNRSPKQASRKRILITGANSLLGHSLFEQMRNDHITIHTGAKANKFVSTIIKKDEASTPLPSETIRVLDVRKKPKNFTKNVLLSDILIIDLQSGTDLEEAEQILKILRQPRAEEHMKNQVLILVSTVFTWANTKKSGSILTDADFAKRVPFPKFQQTKLLENLAITASKFHKKLRTHVICSGLLYGNGEANDGFYEFFRRAWISLHPDLAALPVVGDGKNNLPTIHVRDLARFVIALAEETAQKI